jgi:hypothetical protein
MHPNETSSVATLNTDGKIADDKLIHSWCLLSSPCCGTCMRHAVACTTFKWPRFVLTGDFLEIPLPGCSHKVLVCGVL